MRWSGRRLGFGLVIAALLVGPPPSALSAPLAWQDHATGLAIGGYDPLAYFIDARPRRGQSGFEYQWQGVVFRFVNPGNRAAFERDPHVYAPRFAGYDPVILAGGLAVQGEPEVWALQDGKLYLFESAASRDRWLADPDAILARAADEWRRIAGTIPGPPGL